MNELTRLIHKEIRQNGVISFEQFMEHALYEPGLGYYETQREVGRKGDFITSVSVGKLFGELLAFQFAQWLEVIDGSIQLVEAGAHNGLLFCDILNTLKQWHPTVYERFSVIIVEPSKQHHQWQAETLAEHERKVEWHCEFPRELRGVFFCNELLDAFPVQRLGWDAKGKTWFEWGVASDGDRFVWRRMENLPIQFGFEEGLLDGYVTVLSTRSRYFWGRVSNALRQGRIMAFDYGLEADAFFVPPRKDGTLRAYYRHQIVDDLLAQVAEQDLTASVNFTAIRNVGESAGLESEPMLTQEQFLMDVFEKTLKQPDRFPEWTAKRRRQFQTLVHPEHLGRQFQVLQQVKD
jgi:SAM-dependent MidA family methyltransferase